MQFSIIFCCVAAIFTSSFYKTPVNAKGEGVETCHRCNKTKVKFCRDKEVKNLSSLVEANGDDQYPLERLVVDKNAITLSEDDIKTLEKFEDLRFLDLRHNEITLSHLSSAQVLINHSKLEEIDFTGNQITQIPENFLSNFPKLQVVKFSSNNISKIPKNLLENNTDLKALVLSNNTISELPLDLFKEGNTLEALLVDVNSFGDNGIDMNLLEKMKNLKALNVRDNKGMPRLNPKIFYEKKGLRYLFTSGYADCCNVKRMENLRKQKSKNPIPTSDKLYCSFRKAGEKNAREACAVRIRSGLHDETFMGHVELNLDVPEKWRKLHSSNWTMKEAEAVCKETGHEKALEYITAKNYKRRKSLVKNIFPDDDNSESISFKEPRNCTDKQYSIFRCPSSDVMITESKDGKIHGVGVRCAAPEEKMEKACTNKDGSEINCAKKGLPNLPWQDKNYIGITKIDLQGNQIKWIHDTSLRFFPDLQELDLSHNGLAWLEDYVFVINTLKKLNLKENNLKFVTDALHSEGLLDKARWFEGLGNLTSLDLSSNQLQYWSGNLFKPLEALQNLTMKTNKFQTLSPTFFEHLDAVKLLDISNTLTLKNIQWDKILRESRYLGSLEHLETSYFTDCCFVEALTEATCNAPKDELASCERMIKYSALRYLMWFLVVLTIGGNMFALLMRLVEDDNNRVQNVLICSLSFSDMLMGVYLAGIINQEMATRGEYYKHDYNWRTGILCKVFGIISVLSSEVSVFTLVFIAYDRFLHIVHALEFRKIGYRTTLFLLFITWAGCLTIAVVPATIDSYFYDETLRQGFYGTNSICMPLQLPGENTVAWEYCLAIFGALNFIGAMYLIVAYCQMFYSSYTSAKNSKNSSRLGVHTTMAKRFAAVVFTDVCCWVPIAMLLILSLARAINDSGNLLYMWFSICVIPINSAINPILYTISTPLFWQKVKETLKKVLFCFSKGNTRTNVDDKPELIGSKNREKVT